jgi:hypothetical protein
MEIKPHAEPNIAEILSVNTARFHEREQKQQTVF